MRCRGPVATTTFSARMARSPDRTRLVLPSRVTDSARVRVRTGSESPGRQLPRQRLHTAAGQARHAQDEGPQQREREVIGRASLFFQQHTGEELLHDAAQFTGHPGVVERLLQRLIPAVTAPERAEHGRGGPAQGSQDAAGREDAAAQRSGDQPRLA